MKIVKSKKLARVSLLIFVCIILTLTACSNKKDTISFKDDSGLELNVGIKKSDLEKVYNSKFDNDKFYLLPDQHCCLGFVDNKLAYIELDNTWTWTMSKGPQFNEKMINLVSFFGEPVSEVSAEVSTTINRMDYVFQNVRLSYYGDGERITGIISSDCKVDISIIENDKIEFYKARMAEQVSMMPIVAFHGYQEMPGLNETTAQKLREQMGTPYIELSIGTDKKLYEELFEQSFENEKEYTLTEPACILYFNDDKLDAYTVGPEWNWTVPEAVVDFGHNLSEAMEKHGSTLIYKTSEDGKLVTELTFDLKNGQRISYNTGDGIKIISICVQRGKK